MSVRQNFVELKFWVRFWFRNGVAIGARDGFVLILEKLQLVTKGLENSPPRCYFNFKAEGLNATLSTYPGFDANLRGTLGLSSKT